MDPALGESTGVSTVEEVQTDDTWLGSVLASRPKLRPDHSMSPLRASADPLISSLPLPHRKIESWRFTDLRSIYNSRYTTVAAAHIGSEPHSFDVRRYAPDTAGIVLVFVDGVFDSSLSMTNDESASAWLSAGGYFGSISDYKGDLNRVYRMWGDAEMGSGIQGGLFPTLGNAIASDAVILDVPADHSVSRPVAVVFASTGGPSADRATVSAPRLAIVTGNGSKLSLLECHVTFEPADTFSLALSGCAISLEENSTLSHYILNDCGDDAQVLYNSHAVVGKGATYNCRALGLGGNVGRFTTGIDLEGRECHGLLHSALIAGDRQIQDIHSRICHNTRAATSSQLQKNIAGDKGRVIFSGKIRVTSEGDGTDSEQLSRSLLLSEKAQVDAMPVLEVETDDVQCSHGATVSDLQDDELFYCMSRGISHELSQILLISGFALEILGDCPFPTVAERVTAKIDRLAQTTLARRKETTEYSSI